jgi:hypothetical protein
MRFIIAALICFSLPASANELSSRYEVIGQLNAIVDGEEMLMPIAIDLERDASFADIKVFYGRKMLSITAVTATEDGGWDAPTISLTIGLSSDVLGGLVGVSMSEAGRDFKHPTEAMFPDGVFEMTNFSITEDGEIELDFTAELIRFELDEEWEQTPEEGMSPVIMSGHISVAIPDEFREE